MELADEPEVAETKDILSLIDPAPVVSAAQVLLARWMSDHYMAALFDCLSLMLPPGMERKVLTVFFPGEADLRSALAERDMAVLAYVRERPGASARDIERLVGRQAASRIIAALVKKGLVVRMHELEAPSVRAKQRRYLSLAVSPEEAKREAGLMRKGRAGSQAAVLEALLSAAGPVAAGALSEEAGVAPSAIASLLKKGLLAAEVREVVRDPLSHRSYPPSVAPALTESQAAAWQEIREHLFSARTPRHAVFLLHGVTGSGKTELYLRALEAVVAQGRRGIVLVPEISLTPQTIGRFSARFHGRVAVLHSRLSPGEQHDEWMRIRKGEFDVVIGPRSALFAPQPQLGLIIIDEEHEWSYKQQEVQPRYHARDVALKFAELIGATVILGSATPDVETYRNAAEGQFRLLALPERVTPRGVASLPEVQVVDMREELKSGNRSVFSRPLREALASVLRRQEQAILFLNRRGNSTVVLCRNCGHVVRCRRCQVSLTYHTVSAAGRPGDSLVCHQCGGRYPVPLSCPACMSRAIRFMGVGTEKLEELLWQEFPGARTLRWDRDSASGKRSDEEFLDRFLGHDADVLIGTQMIAKGLDMPLVTLVGVVNADVGMYLPDFRSGERTFQLLCQVAGRAGRGEFGGKVIVQTYNPEHYAVRAAAGHDYRAFYEKEIAFRRSLRQPPFIRLVKLVYSHASEVSCRNEAERFAGAIRAWCVEQGVPVVEMVGPAPAFVSRLRGKYRWQIILKGADPGRLISPLPFPRGWSVDVDPASVA